jgi:hypothetical protein
LTYSPLTLLFPVDPNSPPHFLLVEEPGIAPGSRKLYS